MMTTVCVVCVARFADCQIAHTLQRKRYTCLRTTRKNLYRTDRDPDYE